MVMVMMMTTTALTAVATPHALVLTVSHDLLFRQPPFAAALMPPFLFIGLLVLAIRHSCCRLTAAGKCIRLILNVTSAIAALTLGLTAVLQTPVMRATAPYKCAPTDERLGMNGGDPVCRLFRLSLFAGPALPTSGSRTLKKPAPGIRGGAAPSSRADSVAAS